MSLPVRLGNACSLILGRPVVAEENEHLVLGAEAAGERAGVAIAGVADGIVAVAERALVGTADALGLVLRARSADREGVEQHAGGRRGRAALHFLRVRRAVVVVAAVG